MPFVEVDREGDVTLELAKCSDVAENDKVSILVSSKVLTLASRVFTAMLGPSFLEGQRSASGTLGPVVLPDDDSDAMVTLCHILHFNYSAIPEKPELELFKNLALLCDKYNCITPLKFVSEHWLLLWEGTKEREEMEVFLFISYVFDRPERFSTMSMRIIREFSGSLKHLETLGGFDIELEEVLRSLHHQRKSTLQKIEALVAHRMTLMEQSSAETFSDQSRGRFCSNCWKPQKKSSTCCGAMTIFASCDFESRRGMYVGLLREAKLDPIGLWASMGTKSITEVATCLNTAAMNASKVHSCTAVSKGCPLVSALWGLKGDLDGLKGVASLTRGLCLDCIKAKRETTSLEMTQSEKSLCRVDHGPVYTYI